MKDLELLFYIFSLFAGVASITLAVFINIGHTKKVLRYFIGLDLALFTIQAMITLNLYIERTNCEEIVVSVITDVMDIFGTSFSCLFSLFFIQTLLGKKITKMKQIFIVSIFLFQLLLGTVCYVNTELIILKHFEQLMVISVISAEIFMVLLSYREIPERELKRTGRLFALITLFFLPVFILEYIRPEITALKELSIIKMLALPAYFFILNVGALFWLYTYFNAPAYIAENKLTDFFVKKYCITGKEIEVIELVLSGLTYKQIAEKLFIAPKTVDNHMQNIYKKLQVTSKMQLSNLIRSKEK